jgi:hypothetical protein
MTKGEKIAFVRQLTRNIQQDVCRKIEDGRIPETWDGHELRQYLADRFGDVVYPLGGRREVDYIAARYELDSE